MAEKESIWLRMQRIDRRVLYWILVILLVIPVLRPIGIPVILSPMTKATYNTIKNLPTDSVVLFSVDAGVGALAEVGSFYIASSKYLATLPVKVILWSSAADGPLIMEQYIIPYYEEKGKVYGVDYVNLGFTPGGEAAIARMATGIKETVGIDFFGTPVGELPMLEGIVGAESIDLVITVDSGEATENYIRHWSSPYGIPTISATIGLNVPKYSIFYSAGTLVGIISGARGCAEFENISGFIGAGLVMTDMLSVSHIVLIISIIVGNIGFFAMRAKKREVKG